MRHEDANKLIPMTSYGCLLHSDKSIDSFVIAVVGMVVLDEVLQVQLLKENGAMYSDTNPLLSLGHGGFESCGLRMEVHIMYNYYEFLCYFLSGMKKIFVTKCQNFKNGQE